MTITRLLSQIHTQILQPPTPKKQQQQQQQPMPAHSLAKKWHIQLKSDWQLTRISVQDNQLLKEWKEKESGMGLSISPELPVHAMLPLETGLLLCELKVIQNIVFPCCWPPIQWVQFWRYCGQWWIANSSGKTDREMVTLWNCAKTKKSRSLSFYAVGSLLEVLWPEMNA